MARRTLIPLLLVALSAGCGAKSGPAMTSAPVLPAVGAPVRVADHCSMATDNSLIALDASPATPAGPAAGPGPGVGPGTDHGGALPADFVPVRAISCTTDVQTVPGDGSWQVAIQQEAPAGAVAGLLAAYRTATATVPKGDTSCAAVADLDPRIAFVDAQGNAVWPAAPRDAVCHGIVPAVYAAVRAVPWTVTATRKTVQTSTAGGCSPAWKDMIAIQPTGPAPAGPYFSKAPTTLTVCVYTVNAGTGSAKETDGAYSRERVLTGGDLTKAVTVLDAAPPASACTATATEFAVLLSDGSTRESYLELDGCRRVGRIDTGGGQDRPGLRQLDAAGVAALAGTGS